MDPAEIFALVVGMFLAVVVPHYASSLLRIPPSVTLLVGGAALAFVPDLPVIEPDLFDRGVRPNHRQKESPFPLPSR